jgi:class 3 adenylate cyclase
MTATRRLVAILAADVAGYSRLMGEDEVGTARAVREHREAARPIVVGLGGRIVKTASDGVRAGISFHRRCRRMRDGSIVRATQQTAAHKPARGMM